MAEPTEPDPLQASTTAPRQATCFYDMPPEIRNEIYTLALVRNERLHVIIQYGTLRAYNHWYPVEDKRVVLAVTILRASYTVYSEAVKVLYGSNTFAIRGHVIDAFLGPKGRAKPRLYRTLSLMRDVQLTRLSNKRYLMHFFKTIVDFAKLVPQFALRRVTIQFHEVTDYRGILRWSIDDMASILVPCLKALQGNSRRDDASGGQIEILDLVRFTSRLEDTGTRKAQAETYAMEVRAKVEHILGLR